MNIGGSIADLQVFKADFFRALAHPVRIRLLEELAGGERTVQELQRALGLAQPLVSQQLALLRSRHLVVSRKVGLAVRYTVRDPLILDLLATARQIFQNRLSETQAMLAELATDRSQAS